MIKTYVIKADLETGYSSKASCGNRLDEVTFYRPKKVICVDRDIHESRFTNEELWNKEEVERFIHDARKEGAEEAWALAKKIAGSPLVPGNYNISTLREIFGDGSSMNIFESKYETARKRVSDYESGLNVGDVVTFKDPDYGSDKAVVTFVAKDIDNPNDQCYGLLYEDGTHAVFAREDLVKTGEHIDMTDIFKKLKGEE